MSQQHGPWRYRCPQEHHNWESKGDVYYCNQCEERFDELIDMKKQPLRY